MTHNYRGALCMLGMLSVLLFIYTYLSSGGKIPKNVDGPEAEVLSSFNHMSLVPETLGDNCPEHPYQSGFHDYMVPEWDNGGSVHTQHRYPQVSGGNISLILHQGWDQMMRPGLHDADWMDMPPADLSGYSI